MGTLRTLLLIAAVGGSFQSGLIEAPEPIRAPVESASADVRAWQEQKADELSCQIALQQGAERC